MLELNTQKQKLVSEIESSFEYITLGQGISLRQAECIDNTYEVTPSRTYSDEVIDDWQRVPSDDLERVSVLPFLNPEGFRYYLPAYMVWTLQNLNVLSFNSATEYADTTKIDRVIYCLMLFGRHDQDIYQLNRFSILSARQSRSVAHYLEFMHQYNIFIENIYTSHCAKKAIDDYWGKFL